MGAARATPTLLSAQGDDVMPQSSTQQFSGIFVSYRRDDAAGHAGRLADRLVEHFGRNRIFVDVDAIEPGEDFVTVIENAVGSCEILIAVIGQKWLSATESGRLDNPNNFVRLEIGTALRRNIRVVPVLVQRATMPKPEDLPEDLVKLTRRNAIELTDLRWQTDVDQLIGVLEKVLSKEANAKETAKTGEEQPRQKVEKEERVDEPVPGTENEIAEERDVEPSPFYLKRKRLTVVAGVSLVVLLAATILIGLSQTDHNASGNTSQGATPQPTSANQSNYAKPVQTAELKPPPPSDPFREPTYWKRDDTGTILQIVRNENTVTAIMNSPSATAARAGRATGDMAFKGLVEGRTIKGTANIRFSKNDVRRCPQFNGEQPSDLELTLSADGNTLTGSREDFVLSADCTIEARPRKKLKYIKKSS